MFLSLSNDCYYFRDPDKRDLCLSYLTGALVFSFSLSLNVSTLNKWQTRPLVLAGCWKDSKVEIDIGDDVAAEIVEEAEAVDPPSEFARTLAEPIRDTAGLYMGRGLLNEDEALKIILQSTPVAFSPQTQSIMGLEDETTAENIDSNDPSRLEDVDTGNVSAEADSCYPYGQDTGYESRNEDESLNVQNVMTASPKSPSPEMMLSRSLTVSPTLEWDTAAEPGPEVTMSPCLAQEIQELIDGVEASGQGPLSPFPTTHSPTSGTEAGGPSPSPSSPRCRSPLSDCSSLSLGMSPTEQSPAPKLSLAFRDTIHSPSGGGDLISEQNIRQRRLDGLGFSSPPNVRVASLSLAQNLSLTRCLDLICHEAGLDSQDWRCQDCSKSIGALFGAPRMCHFTRKYYCEDCHNNTDLAIIPARVMYNWDLTQYKVAKSSYLFLRSVSSKPMINISTFSPNLSKLAPVFDQAHRLRKQLIYLSAYLSACAKAGQEGIKVSLAEIVWPREYLYTQTELYSIADLEQLHTGQLVSSLVSAVRLCTRHVTSCLICSGRGFICEICKDKKPVYPFHLDTTSQCKDCNTVFHLHCSKGIISCPRCERIESRNLQWHVNNSKMIRDIGPVDE